MRRNERIAASAAVRMERLPVGEATAKTLVPKPHSNGRTRKGFTARDRADNVSTYRWTAPMRREALAIDAARASVKAEKAHDDALKGQKRTHETLAHAENDYRDFMTTGGTYAAWITDTRY